jgi:hypothetical protein
MDFLHSQLATIQRHLAFVTTDAINWKGYVQAFSWTVTLFETYLLFRQYPLYSKTEPPPVLAAHFAPGTDTFEKSQKYGKDKATFSIFSGLYKQCLDSAMIHFGFYAWAWTTAGRILARFGYGAEYEVSRALEMNALIPDPVADHPIHRVLWCSLLRLYDPHTPAICLPDLCIGREAWLQQDHTVPFCLRLAQRLGIGIRDRRSIPRRFPLCLQVGWRQIRTMAHGLPVCLFSS